MRASMARNRKSRARKRPAKLGMPALRGDHGPSTYAATHGTVIEPLEGDNPNHIGRRRRKSAIEAISLTMRQQQAAKAIEEAWCRLETCSSGGELKEQVDASPKPDATIAQQVEAQSQWHHVMKKVLPSERRLVLWVCTLNRPITSASRRLNEPRPVERFKTAMDRVADHLRY